MTARAGVVRASWRAGSAVCAVWPRWFRRYSATRDPIQRQQDGFMRTSEAAPPDDPAGDQSVSPEALVGVLLLLMVLSFLLESALTTSRPAKAR